MFGSFSGKPFSNVIFIDALLLGFAGLAKQSPFEIVLRHFIMPRWAVEVGVSARMTAPTWSTHRHLPGSTNFARTASAVACSAMGMPDHEMALNCGGSFE
ncbi:hypothetical protein SAMN03159406_04266 [Rhizobium sp. NFR03]|nr:hypothetical protein SAMN03159406_04266 [Rhizobium sp. NFR03]